MVSMNSEIWLAEKLQTNDWFHSVGLDSFGRIVVYVKYLNLDVYRDVPVKVEDHDILIHFASSKEANKDKFIDTPNSYILNRESEFDSIIDVSDDAELIEEEASPDLRSLTIELDRLEKICGTNILSEIFFEIHDGNNAVTNLSVKFPDVRSSMETLYNQYGFDVIYDEMDA